MDEPIDIVFGDCFSDPFCSLNVNVFEREIPEQLSGILMGNSRHHPYFVG